MMASAEQNYQVAQQYFSYELLEDGLRLLVQRLQRLWRFLTRAPNPRPCGPSAG